MKSEFPASAFWDFSRRVYAAPEVAGACLALQQRCAVDVNLLLLGAWLGATGRGVLSEADWRDLGAQVEAWQRQVVGGLRGVRTWLKAMLGGGSELVNALRKSVLACELDAEHLEQLMLEQAVHCQPVAITLSAALRQRHAAANLRNYCRSRALVCDEPLSRILLAVLRGVFADLEQPAALEVLGSNAPD